MTSDSLDKPFTSFETFEFINEALLFHRMTKMIISFTAPIETDGDDGERQQDAGEGPRGGRQAADWLSRHRR